MTAMPEVKANEDVWKRLYAEGKNDLRYPNDVFVRCAHRHLNPERDRNVLDYGFGTGANLIHLAQAGFNVSGVEISQHALDKARVRLEERGLRAELDCIIPGGALKHPPASFDAVVAWQVLCYNNWTTWQAAIAELERVLRPGGIFICATTAPGDVSQTMSETLEEGLYRSRVPGQEGCILVIPNERQLAQCFPGRDLDVGEFGYRMGGIVARHWLITYRKDPAQADGNDR